MSRTSKHPSGSSPNSPQWNSSRPSPDHSPECPEVPPERPAYLLGMTKHSALTPTTPPPALLSTDDLADYLQIPKRTIEAWRATGDGPPFVRFGRRVRYPADLLTEWMHTVTIQPKESR